jgi:hypothetical protein
MLQVYLPVAEISVNLLVTLGLGAAIGFLLGVCGAGGTDEQQQTPPPAEHNGAIPPPAMGNKGIYTEVPNPEAGHEKQVIPPPGTPDGDPNVEPR